MLNILEVNLCKQSQLFATDKFSDVELLRICTFLEETVKYCQRSPPEIPFPTFIHFPVNSQTSVLQLCFNWHYLDSKKQSHFPRTSYWRFPAPPLHLSTLVHVYSLLRLNSQRSALCHSAPGLLFYKTVPTDLSILHVHKSASLGSLRNFEGWMRKYVLSLLMLVSPPRMPFTRISTCWNPNHTSLSLSHMPNPSEMLSLSSRVLIPILTDIIFS